MLIYFAVTFYVQSLQINYDTEFTHLKYYLYFAIMIYIVILNYSLLFLNLNKILMGVSNLK